MTRSPFVDIAVALINVVFRAWLLTLPKDQSHRLDAVEALIRGLLERLRAGLWSTSQAVWTEEAEVLFAFCPVCGRACERKHHRTPVMVEGLQLSIANITYSCRHCHQSENPLARWLGLRRGQVSLSFDHQVVSLSVRMSFHEAGEQMRLQHGQKVDVGKVERVTQRVARDAQLFVAEQHERAKRSLQRLPLRKGVALLIVTTDGGGASVGKLVRPPPDKAKAFTSARRLPVGKRPRTHREVRVIVAHEPEETGRERKVDVHLSVLEHPEKSGDRMLVTAARAGLGRTTHVHGVFDMGGWIRPQFVRVFKGYSITLCADQQHVRTYLKAAASVLLDGEPERTRWMTGQEGHLHAGRWRSIVEALSGSDEPEVLEARRYIVNHHEDMDWYGVFAMRGLPVSSGEAEGEIRHVVRKRLDNAGVWREENLPGMTALLGIWESGEWDEFFAWREERDRSAFQARQEPGWHRSFGSPKNTEERAAA